MPVQRKQIRSLAEQLLTQHGIHVPPAPVEKIAEILGLEVRRAPAEDELLAFFTASARSEPQPSA